MARKLAIDGQAVAYAVLEQLLGEDEIAICWENQDVNGVAHHMLEAADLEYQPRARKLILTFDLSGETADPPRTEFVDDEPVGYVPSDAPPQAD